MGCKNSTIDCISTDKYTFKFNEIESNYLTQILVLSVGAESRIIKNPAWEDWINSSILREYILKYFWNLSCS